MVPDPDLQLSVVIKALRDVVAEAVDPANRLAIEQLQVSIATLSLLKQRLSLLHRCARAELVNALALGGSLLTVVGRESALDSALEAARAALDDPDTDTAELGVFKARLLAAASAVVEAGTGDRAIAQAVITASKPQLDLGRAWCLPAGFELNPKELPALADLLRKNAHAGS